MSCPRCASEAKHLRTEHQGVESGEVIWTVYYCKRCSFTWRDSELPESIDYEAREAWFRVDPDKRDQYPHNIPPAKPKTG
ncbi:MAG: C4-type Zn-finger protein [Gammaproteobacteria bacterium]|jgi:C4-type Zn-finger protein